MSSRILKILVGLIIIGGPISYLFVLNPHPVELNLGRGRLWEGQMALLLVAVFTFGAIFSGFIALAIGARHWFSDWKVQRQHDKEQRHYRDLIEGRELVAAGDHRKAIQVFRRLVDQLPDEVVARIELARALQRAGKLQDALTVVEEARGEGERNVELILLGAELNLALAHPTAAYDSLSLGLKRFPHSAPMLALVVEASENLERFDRAIDYQQQRIKHAATEEKPVLQEELARLEFQQATNDPSTHTNNGNSLESRLESVLKRHRDFPPALVALARGRATSGDAGEATSLLKKAYDKDPRGEYCMEIARLWLSGENPQKAITSLRSIVKSSDDPTPARIVLCNLFLHLEMLSEAGDELRLIDSAAASDISVLVCRARLLRREGKLADALQVLLEALAKAAPDVSATGFGKTREPVATSAADVYHTASA